MSELKADRTFVFGEECLAYKKEDADRVIAELEDKLRHYPIMAALLESDKKEIAELKDKLQSANEQIENLINSASGIMLFQDRVNDDKCAELRHLKYRRCLVMYHYCAIKALYELDLKGNDVEWKWYSKWMHKWFKLAEKFKEAK